MSAEINKISIFFRIEKDLQKKLKVFAAQSGKTIQLICAEAINFYLESKKSEIDK